MLVEMDMAERSGKPQFSSGVLGS